MSDRDPRKMASQIAAVRASETHLPEDERVFNDPYAEFFLPDEMRAGLNDVDEIRTAISRYEQMMPGVNGAIAARVRFIDDFLLACIADGFKQLVIIGAGFDTRPYRFEEVKAALSVFEVDHPATQQIKIEKIKDIFRTLPNHVIYVPLVFGADRLDRKLLESGYKSELKTLYIVEGLLMYIPPQAVEELLSFIVKASGPGSALVADYFSTSVIEGTSPLKEAQMLRQFVQSEGAPLQFGIEEEKVEEFFQQRGFAAIKSVSAAACKAKYFHNAGSWRTVSPMFNFVHATVPPDWSSNE